MVATLELERPMSAKRNDVSVKLDADVVSEAKMVAASLDKSLAEYLSELLRPLVRQDLEKEIARRSIVVDAKPDAPSPKRSK